MRYSTDPKDRIYIKGYGFLSFTKNMDTILIIKCSKKLLDIAKKSTRDTRKTASKKSNSKNKTEATGELIGNKIADTITSVSKKSKNN